METFLKLMTSAAQIGMKRTLACCEYCIARDYTGKFNETLQFIPTGSSARIVHCLRWKVFHATETLSPERFLSLALTS